MRQTIAGIAIAAALLALVPAALTAGSLGWGQPWLMAFGASGLILLFGLVVAAIAPPD
ncbi:MAG: hypothetical protein QOF33_2193 [Thermomicrobiales bacterium]|jgi:ABC-type transport system involved in multi-copper enzyme maturation permease subunit|nr:hypothetical protein [Thermomicrobiales bacterium]MEA2584108.1 hypothetical protein [Thermomicrobiales bacterium]